jgi:hypothetical protein
MAKCSTFGGQFLIQFGKRFVLPLGPMLFLFTLLLSACSKQNGASDAVTTGIFPQTFPISSTVLMNCRFKNPTPIYTVGSPITPNSILCDEGVATSVSLLNATPLPSGLSFSMPQLSLIGTPTQKIPQTLFQFYIENESGYVILKMQMTVK